MTREEAILISAYTGYMLVPSGEFGLVHEACEKALGRPVWTHEFASKQIQQQLKDALFPQVKTLIEKTFEEAE